MKDMKDAISRWLGRTLFDAHLDALFLRNTAVVVAFHRVQHAAGQEGLTVDVEMFERYCRFFRHHFRVVSLPSLVDRLERGLPLDRQLAITFDDGYLDNFENAVPILEKLSLPATFFLVSQWIGTDIVPWWDEAAGQRHPWMTWDQVRSLHRRGFDIGGHTRTHVDLGAVHDAPALEEITLGRAEIEQQLGAPVEMFAYPYGRQTNLLESNRELVRQAGYRCCCSCFGGVVGRGADPFRLLRVPVSPRHASPHQFGLEVALRRSVVPAEPAAHGFHTHGEHSCCATSEATGS
jgi:peptidoglycan/xylan/chitin deacetylase (PgdA/CDA1 family)